MAIQVHDKDLLRELQKLNALAAEIKDLLTKIHDCICDEVTGIGVEIQPPTPQ